MNQAGGYEDYAFVAELYDHVIPYRDRADVSFFVEAAQIAGQPVLEVGCGTGRVLIPTARAGVVVTGLDLSTHMLGICRGRLLQEPLEVQERVNLQQADMRDFDLGQTFNLITLPFRPFQLLTTVEDQIACLKTIHRHLAPGGRLILDLFNPALDYITRDNIGQEMGEEPPFVTEDGRTVVRRHKITSRDYLNQTFDVEALYYITHSNGTEETSIHAFTMRYIFRFEAEHLLARCGFAIEHLYADYEKQPYGSIYPGELIFIARKMRKEGVDKN